ncbi:MAG: hypothetical protein IPF48_10315 [Sphingomonadales bacterium]|nr:hypothetical protein [Sphingomonadales bacterium]
MDDAKELSWVADIQIKRSTALDKSHLRGLILKHNPGMMPHAMTCNHTIILANGMTAARKSALSLSKSLCIAILAPMAVEFRHKHEINFENHMNEFFVDPAAIESRIRSKPKKKPLWMAMSALAPEQLRREYRQQVLDGKPIAEVATDLRIPIRTAAAFLSPQYEREISSILE